MRFAHTKTFTVAVILASLLVMPACGGAATPEAAAPGGGEVAAPTGTPTEPEQAVEPSPTPAEPTITPVPPVTVTFTELADGDTITPEGNGPLGPQSRLYVRFDRMEIGQRAYLEIDGLIMGLKRLEREGTYFDWWPWHGNGEYTITVSLWPSDFCCELGSQTIRVNVTGIPDEVETLQEQFIRIYRERFGRTLTQPAIARYVMPWEDALEVSRWLSVAYFEGSLIEIDIFDDGRVEAYERPLNRGGMNWSPICSPNRHLNMLVVFVDYGNTGITQEQAFATLDSSVAWHNQRWADLLAAQGVGEPLLQASAEAAWMAAPTPGQMLTIADIRAGTGMEPDNYDIVIEIDLDSAVTVSAYGGVGLGGLGCFDTPANRTGPDIYFAVTSLAELQDRYLSSVFDHELAHSLGWMHWWPNGDGSVAQQFQTDSRANFSMSTRLFGWMDIDGDGIIELLDPDPYGMQE